MFKESPWITDNLILRIRRRAVEIIDVKRIAGKHGIKTGKMKKSEIIRSIQRAEGNFDCFGSAVSGECTQGDCLWKKDCLTKA